MVGSRDLRIFPVYGQEKNNGALDAPLFPTNGILLLVATIGGDAQRGFGVVGTPDAVVSTTLASGGSAGLSTIDVSSPAGIVLGTTILQIGTNLAGDTAECRLVTNLVGSTATLDAPLGYSHSTGDAVVSVIAPFTHTITNKPVLPSLTIEKNLGNFQSLQFAGARVNKFELKGESTDTEAKMTCDVLAQSVAILDTPSAFSFLDETPFVFSEFDLKWDGGELAQASNFTLAIDNGVKGYWTFNGSHDLQFLPALKFDGNGAFDVVWDSLDDATYGYFQKITDGTEGELHFKLAHPIGPGPGGAYNTGYSVEIVFPFVRLAKDSLPSKVDDVIMETINWEARRSLGGSGLNSSTAYAIVKNAVHLPLG